MPTTITRKYGLLEAPNVDKLMIAWLQRHVSHSSTAELTVFLDTGSVFDRTNSFDVIVYVAAVRSLGDDNGRIEATGWFDHDGQRVDFVYNSDNDGRSCRMEAEVEIVTEDPVEELSDGQATSDAEPVPA